MGCHKLLEHYGLGRETFRESYRVLRHHCFRKPLVPWFGGQSSASRWSGMMMLVWGKGGRRASLEDLESGLCPRASGHLNICASEHLSIRSDSSAPGKTGPAVPGELCSTNYLSNTEARVGVEARPHVDDRNRGPSVTRSPWLPACSMLPTPSWTSPPRTLPVPSCHPTQRAADMRGHCVVVRGRP